jgi:hypothetical protein
MIARLVNQCKKIINNYPTTKMKLMTAPLTCIPVHAENSTGTGRAARVTKMNAHPRKNSVIPVAVEQETSPRKTSTGAATDPVADKFLHCLNLNGSSPFLSDLWQR